MLIAIFTQMSYSKINYEYNQFYPMPLIALRLNLKILEEILHKLKKSLKLYIIFISISIIILIEISQVAKAKKVCDIS